MKFSNVFVVVQKLYLGPYEHVKHSLRTCEQKKGKIVVACSICSYMTQVESVEQKYWDKKSRDTYPLKSADLSMYFVFLLF